MLSKILKTLMNLPRYAVGYTLMAAGFLVAVLASVLVKFAAFCLDIKITKTHVTAEEVTREDIDTDELRRQQAEYLAAKAKRDYPPED